jgi:hypothetical protein
MRSVFQREDIWDLFDSELLSESSTSKTKEKGKEAKIQISDEDRQKVATEKHMKGKAMAYLCLSVTLEIRPRIEDLKEPIATWRYLQGAFQTNTITDIIMVLNQWA